MAAMHPSENNGVISRRGGSMVRQYVGRKSTLLGERCLPNHVQKPFEAENLRSPLDTLEYLINNRN